MRVVESLTAKVGPLPAWAWGLGLGGLIIGVRAYHARHATPSTPAAAVTSDGEAATAGANLSGDIPADATQPGTVGGYSIPSNYQANPGGVIIGPDGNLTEGSTGAVNNGDWSNQAFDVLRARGYASLASSEAIRKYLAGDPLTPAEEGMIGIVLTALGQPPEGAPAISKATNTAGSAPTPPASTPPIQQWTPRVLFGPQYIGRSGLWYSQNESGAGGLGGTVIVDAHQLDEKTLAPIVSQVTYEFAAADQAGLYGLPAKP